MQESYIVVSQHFGCFTVKEADWESPLRYGNADGRARFICCSQSKSVNLLI